jgi:hypothetical protein
MKTRGIILKTLAFWIGYIVLHYAYDFIPIGAIAFISGTDESFFQHQKIGFFTYAFVCVGEYFIRRKEIKHTETFVYARLFTTMLMPWFIFILWFTGPAYLGELPTMFLEILFSNVIVILVSLAVLVVERWLDRQTFNRGFKAVTAALFVISVSLFVIFTQRLPWCDVFADPTLIP